MSMQAMNLAVVDRARRKDGRKKRIAGYARDLFAV
jgi:hypothetical protein